MIYYYFFISLYIYLLCTYLLDFLLSSTLSWHPKFKDNNYLGNTKPTHPHKNNSGFHKLLIIITIKVVQLGIKDILCSMISITLKLDQLFFTFVVRVNVVEYPIPHLLQKLLSKLKL
jgi:hypothetical protein